MQSVSVLIVENDHIQSANLKNQLERLAYNVVGVAANGADALEIASRKRPDIVIMDIEIDGPMDGIETANQIYADHQTPIIYLSQFEDLNTYRNAKRHINAAYVAKPLSIVNILSAIERLLFSNGSDEPKIELPKIEDRIFVKNGNGHYAVFVEDIIFIEANREVTVIHHANSDKPSTVGVNLGTLEKKLSAFRYLARCSRYHMINLNKVTRIKDKLVETPSTGNKSLKKVVELGQHEIVISDKYKGQVVARFHMH